MWRDRRNVTGYEVTSKVGLARYLIGSDTPYVTFTRPRSIGQYGTLEEAREHAMEDRPWEEGEIREILEVCSFGLLRRKKLIERLSPYAD